MGLLGNVVRVLGKTDFTVDVVGIDLLKLLKLPVFSAGGRIKTNRDNFIAIIYEYAGFQTGKAIHSSAQTEDFDLCVDEKSVKVGGSQSIKTRNGYVIPLDIKNGLSYIPICLFLDQEWYYLPRVVLTSDKEWYPCALDHNLTTDVALFDAKQNLTPEEQPFQLLGSPSTNMIELMRMILNQIIQRRSFVLCKPYMPSG